MFFDKSELPDRFFPFSAAGLSLCIHLKQSEWFPAPDVQHNLSYPGFFLQQPDRDVKIFDGAVNAPPVQTCEFSRLGNIAFM